jgi:hypothetical protein
MVALLAAAAQGLTAIRLSKPREDIFHGDGNGVFLGPLSPVTAAVVRSIPRRPDLLGKPH